MNNTNEEYTTYLFRIITTDYAGVEAPSNLSGDELEEYLMEHLYDGEWRTRDQIIEMVEE